MMTRRQFLKLKLFALLGYFNPQLHALASTQVVVKPYDILDKLLTLPFSDETRHEVLLRVGLQKKYGYDSNGKQVGLQRFFREIGHFIISNYQEADFKRLYALQHEHIDKFYYFNKAAQYNNVEALLHVKQTLIGVNDDLLNEALIFAVKGRSVDTTIVLLRDRINITPKTEAILVSLFEQETSREFVKELTGSPTGRLLPYQHHMLPQPKRRKFSKKMTWGNGYQHHIDAMENRANIVFNALIDLFYEDLLDDFQVINRRDSQMRSSISVNIWNDTGIYDIDFINRFDEALRFNGFDENFEYDETLIESPRAEKRHRVLQVLHVEIN